MRELSRRSLIAGLVVGGPAFAAGNHLLSAGKTPRSKRVAIIGGGPAGVAAALALHQADTSARLMLIERDPATLNSISSAQQRFQKPSVTGVFNKLKAAGIEIALDEIADIDWQRQNARGISGRDFAFDDIVVAPGTTVQDEGIAGLDAIARHRWPAAWGSPREAKRLTAQLATMREGGHAVLRLPSGDVSHPAGLPHRAVEIAELLARKNPTSRLTVLDATHGTQAADAFASAIAGTDLGQRVEWLGRETPVEVREVDAYAGRLETSYGAIQADVVNFITAQEAGAIAQAAGLADHTGWCPCGDDMRSLINPGAIVVGDANRLAQRTVDGAVRSGVEATRTLLRA